MDIVSRLKEFINHIAIPVTQFADNCKIPRPTLSQLLNGRNKKVSDELINKIHTAYPKLSMLWLMFGEGEMLGNMYNETSEAETGSVLQFDSDQQSSNESVMPQIDFEKNFAAGTSENFDTDSDEDSPSIETDSFIPKEYDPHRKSATITFGAEDKKKIVNIIVYYDDNSFESFVPESSKPKSKQYPD